jgi:hypothetical protein
MNKIIRHDQLIKLHPSQEEFEDTKGVIRIRKSSKHSL